MARSRYGPFRTDRGDWAPPPLLRAGITQFNRGEYFAQHETLEELWRAERDEVRYLYQGILLVGVGLYHWQRGNYRGAVAKLETALRFLQWFRPVCQAVDVETLIADTTRVREALVALGPARLTELDPALIPRVHLR
jgi:predicted metal-dependent hydrolase